jgi:hypothetical protein
MIFTPARDYPSNYDESVREIVLACPCHKGVAAGYAVRTGFTELESYPVYKIFSSREHPEYIDRRVALAPTGFVNPVGLINTGRAR